MFDEAAKRGGSGTFHGYILMDEMSIQQDLQIVKRGRNWSIVGAVDLGCIVNSLDELSTTKKNMKMATHCFQYLYVGFNGFRWPIAYFGSDNVNGHAIYLTFWPLIDQLASFGFNVHACIMDGSSNNRQFTHLVIDPNSARVNRYTTINPFKLSARVCLIQDCKHVFKKIRNSLLKSVEGSKREITLNGKPIFWVYFQNAYLFNINREFRYYHKLTRAHVFLTPQAKMRNHLATDVLGPQMFDLMTHYKSFLGEEGHCLESVLELLEHTSFLVSFFMDTKSKLTTVGDPKVSRLFETLRFFHSWEDQYLTTKDQTKYLITRETRQDIDSCLYGFVSLLSVAERLKLPLVPGYINSDLIENWFCQHRGLRNGFNQNPTLCQIASATNANIITGSVVSSKGNAGGLSYVHKGVMPPTKKFKACFSQNGKSSATRNSSAMDLSAGMDISH